jgi:hypothetical protein
MADRCKSDRHILGQSFKQFKIIPEVNRVFHWLILTRPERKTAAFRQPASFEEKDELIQFGCTVGQRVASRGISVLQKGQVLLVGSAATSSFLSIARSLLMPFTNRKMMNAMIRKLMIVIKKKP